LGVFFQLPTHPDSGPFHAAPHHFSLKYVSIPAKKCLAQRKNLRCRSHWALEEYTLGILYGFVLFWATFFWFAFSGMISYNLETDQMKGNRP